MKIAADILMIIHLAWAAFMVIGLPLGLLLRSPLLRWVHFWGMAVTALFAGIGMYCPLTVWEEALRWKAGESFSYEGSFLARHLSAILYPQVDPMILRGLTVFWGILTVAAMLLAKPGRRQRP